MNSVSRVNPVNVADVDSFTVRSPANGIGHRPGRVGVLALLVAVTLPLASGEEWPHIMGPNLNRKTSEKLPAAWPKGGPKKMWQVPVEGGFSSFVTGDGRAYTIVQQGGRETAVALDRKTGKTLWQTPMAEAEYARGGERGVGDNTGGDGPRGTPVFAGGRVFVFGGKFDLYALDAATGRVVWKHDLLKEFGGREIHWSNAASPLVVGDRVLVMGGGKGQTFIAFRANNGEVAWKSGNDRATYSTPILAKIQGVEQALFMVERGLVSLDPSSGKELWHYPFPFRTATAASPIVWQDIVNVSAGYGVGGGACKVTKKGDTWEVAEHWRSPGNRDNAAHWSTAVEHDGYLYGCYGHGEYGSGRLKCVDIRTGKVLWEKPGFGHGQTIMVGGKLLITSDAGRLVLFEPNPKAYQEIATANAVDGKVWASLALSDNQLFMRSTKHAVALEF